MVVDGVSEPDGAIDISQRSADPPSFFILRHAAMNFSSTAIGHKSRVRSINSEMAVQDFSSEEKENSMLVGIRAVWCLQMSLFGVRG